MNDTMSLLSIVIPVVLLLWVSVLSYLFYNFYSKIQTISKGNKELSIVDILNKVISRQNSIEKRIDSIDKNVDGLIFDAKFYIQKIGLVRFNPFNDTGGDQSFILALINSENSGVVISGLHTRNGTRWYAKKVENGKGVDHVLSDDEIRAIKSATKKIKV